MFALYSVIKPLTSAAILVVMFGMVTHGNFSSAGFSYMYIGNAFYMYVGAIMAGMAQAVIDDRERFRTLKSMYVAPVNIPMYLVGRGIARFMTTSLSVAITIVFGVAFLQVQLHPGEVRWVLLIASLCIGIVMLAMMGLALASIVLTIANGSWLVGEAVAGALYLFCGAVFPLDALPAWLRPVGYVMPVTYWLELIRRSLASRVAHQYPSMAGITDGGLLTALLALTLAVGAMSAIIFRRCDYIARERGLIDRTTNY